MVRLIAAARLSKALFTNEKTFTVEPLHNRQNRCQLLKGQQLQNHGSQSCSGLCDALGQNLRHWKDAVGLHHQKRQNQRRQLSAPYFTGRTGDIEYSTLPRRQNHALARLSSCTFGPINDFHLFPGFWSDEIWPSYSADLNPLDYSLLSY
ncbi:hypothetical protein KIN20_010908 [Parelaphostrongylus tenuis]|uniref:Uncharacterized protein n=1 Tax=Parelaphostrongylus tenuis TaxID=148309 RepID=A0AAD5M8L0_PARTN|nr:hypothetical protein KIN20_010908 [Parelaphostrongylus tenuis]